MQRVFINIFTTLLIVQCCTSTTTVSGQQQSGSNSSMALCDINGIHAEITKAIHLLKEKQKQVAQTHGLVRQDDDDEEIPYYVPAIAKVIGSVLAQNATNVIEESFGFIPPEVNKNIRYVLGLVAETVEKLRPMTSTTPNSVNNAEKIPTTSGNNTNAEPSEAQVAEIEALLAYALAQQIGPSIGVNISELSDHPVTPLFEDTDVTSKPLTLNPPPKAPISSATPDSTAELFSSTFKYSDVKAINSERVASGEGLAIYAPAYAPNYVEASSTPKILIYAPAFDHQTHTASPPQKLTNKGNATEETTEESSTDEGDVSTEGTLSSTPDDDDEDYEDGK